VPLVIAAITGSFISYKLGRTSRRRMVLKIIFWVFLLIGLILVQPLYRLLYDKQLTESEPLSLFDVLQITGIIYVFYTVNRLYARLDSAERRFQDLHQELSIRLSEKER
jgi:hypothetical protein